MAEENSDSRSRSVERAVLLVTQALDLLDAYGGPAEAAAHLDLALRTLREDAARLRSKT